ncbi:hypothetical protein BDA96_06G101400 [Sorghum bicolor]|jgi:E3 ubiquitin-protein ligase EL5|uniref:RING-type E3 ubiquitin transferase n=2 Tax=Sorghum bicolor TaxID=4558 RepID=A0A921UBV7_SORBI|nr:E3 ubiquitin-protein ligase EL5 [Sorghum bicolor]EES10862.1 hypothetical protein SORBI_3006G092200 [Sorghum bicolor]KAG0525939.1 hypothetical protein BDA96_06G101400 [Sorghum bicolor]|eukprot:XP_002446534.1 E3 ubiquitin-protein ligase EL5 [Sorghum bicolor]
MSALPENIVAGGSGPAPVPWWSASSPVGGDVVLSGVVLLFAALAFAFVLYHYFTVTVVSRRGGSGTRERERDGAAVGPPSSAAQQRGTLLGGRDGHGLDPSSVLRALPLTVYKAKGRAAGEALECAVCLAELTDGEAARFLPRCQHGFHAECIDLWLRGHSTCPLCRVDVDLLPPAPPSSSSSSSALPPALPEPANYPMNLPTNVLFWGSQDAVTVARLRASGTRTTTVHSGPSAPSGASPPLAIHVREATPPAVAPPTREGDAAKAQGLLARLSSLRRLWSRGSTHDAAAIGHTLPCRATNHLV